MSSAPYPFSISPYLPIPSSLKLQPFPSLFLVSCLPASFPRSTPERVVYIFKKLLTLNNKLLRILQNRSYIFPVKDLYHNFDTWAIPELHIHQLLMLVHNFLHHKHLLPTATAHPHPVGHLGGSAASRQVCMGHSPGRNSILRCILRSGTASSVCCRPRKELP